MSASISACSLASVSAGGVPCRRSVPDRSIQASSSERPCTSGVRVRTFSKMRRLSVRYLVKSGGRMVAWGQSLRALNIGMAERTPLIRAM